MTRPIFYTDKLNNWDKITMTTYFVILCGIWFCYDKSLPIATQKNILLWLGLGTQILLYAINYKSLRNLKVYFFWVLISILHLYLFFYFKSDPKLIGVGGHYATILRNTFPLLILFQVLRFISAKTQGLELVSLSKGSTTDIFDERRITFIDFILFIIYFATTFILATVDWGLTTTPNSKLAIAAGLAQIWKFIFLL